MRLGCCYNPHIGGILDPEGGPAEASVEFDRLIAKLKTGVVTEIWLQFGADTNELDRNLSRLEAYLSEESRKSRKSRGKERGKEREVRIIGSLFIPSKSWLAKMKFRCWSGCYLGTQDGEYLSSP